jgi:hypothetical protein
MTDAKLAAIVCLCVLAVSAGCTERDVPADAEIVVKNATVQGEQVRLTVVAWLDGGTHNVTVHDAAVCSLLTTAQPYGRNTSGPWAIPQMRRMRPSGSTLPLHSHQSRFVGGSARLKIPIISPSLLGVQNE